MAEFKEKLLEDYTEEELKKMFIDMFFWVLKNRQEWLEEAVIRRKRELGRIVASKRKLKKC